MSPANQSTYSGLVFSHSFTAHAHKSIYKVNMDKTRNYYIFELQMRSFPGNVVYYAAHRGTGFSKRCQTYTGAKWACIDHRRLIVCGK